MPKIVLEAGKHTFEQYVKISNGEFNVHPSTMKMKPYDATNNLCQAIQLMKSNPELNKNNVQIPDTLDSVTTTVLRVFMPENIRDWFRVVEIDSDLINVIENTNNDIFHRKCFIDNIFINCKFSYNEYIIIGVLVSDTSAEHVKCKIRDENGYTKDNLVIASMIYNRETKEYGFLITDLFSQADKTVSYVRTVVCNILDLVTNNCTDINIVDTASFKKSNKPKDNKQKVKHEKIFIKADGEFKKYAKSFSKNNRCKHKFIVRGHFRHYTSNRFNEELRKSPKWIKPFYKGSGIIIKKDYSIK